ncbi:hypothetical protein [Tuberibacillus sp. Marseille-P3662]|uniref:hypothetical protein n=1 Tax=Tuberibacillus sp. Marseille-P3662 TaxID=1965358 RepID=UPI000A1C7FCC|nr:hypothetical protein [Tuberibacillus sp. Marseille-P3662]
MESGKNLVVDTSVSFSASKKIHPISSMCREFLLELFNSPNSLVMSDEIESEWRKRASKFSLKLLGAFKRRRKVKYINNVRGVHNLRNVIGETKDRSRVGPMLKDVHLIEAALVTDQIVVSCDEKVRDHFYSISHKSEYLRLLIWVNPTKPNEEPISWLKDGANILEEKKLSNWDIMKKSEVIQDFSDEKIRK